MPSREVCEVTGHGEGHARRAREGGDGHAPRALRALAGSSLSGRFRSWSGRSGRRYVFSVYKLDATSAVDALLPVGPAVVIGVETGAGEARVARFVAETGVFPEMFFASARVADLRARTGAELHLHLTAADEAERRAIAVDLRCIPHAGGEIRVRRGPRRGR